VFARTQSRAAVELGGRGKGLQKGWKGEGGEQAWKKAGCNSAEPLVARAEASPPSKA
jgi:hypothetical protein